MENFSGVLITFDLKIEKLEIYFDYKNESVKKVCK